MRVRLTAVALAVMVLATSCGGSGRRASLTSYITQANAIEAKLAQPLLEISVANRTFARQRGSAQSVLAKLERSDATIKKLDLRLAVLPFPIEAQHLRSLLLEIGTREQALVVEVEELVTFLPRFDSVLAPLTPSSTTLKHDLAGKSKLPAKVASLELYRKQLAGVVARLRMLSPPPSSRPVWSQQIATLVRVRASAEALALALRDKRAKAIPALLHSFDAAAVSNQGVAAQRARIAAVVAYNARIASLNRLGTSVAREAARLRAST